MQGHDAHAQFLAAQLEVDGQGPAFPGVAQGEAPGPRTDEGDRHGFAVVAGFDHHGVLADHHLAVEVGADHVAQPRHEGLVTLGQALRQVVEVVAVTGRFEPVAASLGRQGQGEEPHFGVGPRRRGVPRG